MSTSPPVLAVTGLLAEARIASGPGVVAIAGGGNAAWLAALLDASLSKGARAIISFGIAGGLEPGLKPGMTIIARSVMDAETSFPCDPDWMRRLTSALPDALSADIAGIDQPVCDQDGKKALRASTGAAAADMESHVAARFAARHGLPFAALRTIADPADRTLPSAALVGMRPDGSTNVGAVLRALSRHPGELPALILTALDARAAFAALSKSRRRLGPRLGYDTISTDPGRPGAFDGPPGVECHGFPTSHGSGVELPAKSA